MLKCTPKDSNVIQLLTDNHCGLSKDQLKKGERLCIAQRTNQLAMFVFYQNVLTKLNEQIISNVFADFFEPKNRVETGRFKFKIKKANQDYRSEDVKRFVIKIMERYNKTRRNIYYY